MIKVKPLKYQSLSGLSERQLKEHHNVLYAGYVKKVNEIRNLLKDAQKSNANTTFSNFRELQNELTFALNGVKLHEAYFANLGANGVPDGNILDFFKQGWGSFESYKKNLIACGMSARGWVVTAFDLNDNRLYNFTCDAHNKGCIWNAIPLVVLDVYEHAYFIDYATNRKDYLQAFLDNIDFKFINSKIAKYQLL